MPIPWYRWRQGIVHRTVAGLVCQHAELTCHRIDEEILDRGSNSQLLAERRAVLVAALGHLLHKKFVAVEQRSRLAYPSKCLRMPGVSACSAVHREDVPQSVQLSVLAKEVLPAQDLGGDVPDPHRARLSRTSSRAFGERSRYARSFLSFRSASSTRGST